jgi:hypothetical protein
MRTHRYRQRAGGVRYRAIPAPPPVQQLRARQRAAPAVPEAARGQPWAGPPGLRTGLGTLRAPRPTGLRQGAAPRGLRVLPRTKTGWGCGGGGGEGTRLVPRRARHGRFHAPRALEVGHRLMESGPGLATTRAEMSDSATRASPGPRAYACPHLRYRRGACRVHCAGRRSWQEPRNGSRGNTHSHQRQMPATRALLRRTRLLEYVRASRYATTGRIGLGLLETKRDEPQAGLDRS